MRAKPGWRTPLLLLWSITLVGCAAERHSALHHPADGAERAALHRSMAAIVEKIQRATRTIEAVAEARSSILGLVVDAPSGGAEPEPVDHAEKLERVRGELADVRARLQVHRYRFSPEVLELRLREDELVERERQLQRAARR
jgi:hypothetical protein